MASAATADRLTQRVTTSNAYERFGGVCALLSGVAGFLYSIAFVVLRSSSLSALFLALAGILGAAALIAVYQRLRANDSSFALWALVLGLAGTLGSFIHGGYDLANAINPPASVNLDAPSQIDPRGLLTFGAAGLGLWVVAWLILRSGLLPRGLGYLGYLTAALLMVIYLARLIILDATSPLVLVPAVVAGFVASPAFYVYLGVSLWRGPRG